MNCPAAIQAAEMKSQWLKARDGTTGDKPQWYLENACKEGEEITAFSINGHFESFAFP